MDAVKTVRRCKGMNPKKDIFKSILVLTLLCLTVSGTLAAVNRFTAPVSAANAAVREEKTRKSMIPEAEAFIPLAVGELPKSIVNACRAETKDGGCAGYVFTVRGKGFGGTITVMCAIADDGTVLRCEAPDVSSETTTLGGKVADPAYSAQYVGKDERLEGVDGISGATITSNAYRQCVRDAFAAYRAVKEVGK